MAFFHTFVFVFSLRLGAIIIGTLTLLKSSVWLIFQVWGLECISELHDLLKDVTKNQYIFENLAEWINLYDNLKYYIIGLAVFYSLEIFICIFLLIGAYQCKLNFIYPFCWFYILYLLFICLDMSLIYLIMKKDNEGLGFTIAYISIAFFVLVYCLYAWFCIFSLIDVIKILQRQVLQKVKSQGLKRDVIPKGRRCTFRNK